MFLRVIPARYHSLGENHPDTVFAVELVKDIFIANGGTEDSFHQWFQNQISLLLRENAKTKNNLK